MSPEQINPGKNKEGFSEKEEDSGDSKQERLTQINQKLEDFNSQKTSGETIPQIKEKKEEEYNSQISEFEEQFGALSNESKEVIYKNTVDEAVDQVQKEQERVDQLHIKKTILENIEDENFRQRISPTESENLTEETFEKALNQFLNTEKVDLPENERVKLFRQTIEYYVQEKSEAEKPVWHSTSSFSLRKGLEEGFSGGKISGGEDASKEYTEKPLSITHPNYSTAEDFQQMFARLCAKGNESLSVDSEELTGESLPKHFYESFIKQLSKEEKKELIAKRLNSENDSEKEVKTEEVTDDMIDKMTGPQAISEIVNDFEQRNYLPPTKVIEEEVLPTIESPELKADLEHEAHNPFPCMITFELSGKEERSSSVSKGESPTHIPFEDHFSGKFSAEDMKEIRVPLNKIGETERWLQDKGLSDINIVPMEVYEVKRLVENNIEK